MLKDGALDLRFRLLATRAERGHRAAASVEQTSAFA
jgi:hypothetical protein